MLKKRLFLCLLMPTLAMAADDPCDPQTSTLGDCVMEINKRIQSLEKENKAQQAEIQALKMRLSLSDGLVAHYPFDGNANDASGHGNHGTVNGATLTKDRFGNANSAYEFDGVDDRIVVPSSKSLNPGTQLTVAFWLKLNRNLTKDWSPIIYKGNESDCCKHREYTVWLNKKRYLHYTSAGDAQAQHHLNTNNIQLNEWIFFTGVIDRDNHFMKVYLNGTLDGQKDDSYSSFTNGNDDLEFGGKSKKKNWFSSLDGVFDDIRIYNRALTDVEIQSLYKLSTTD